MRIVINHDSCQHSAWYSDQCLSATLRNPQGHQRFCGVDLKEDDGQSALTVDLIMDGKVYTLVLHDQAEVEAAASDGSAAFLRDGVVHPLEMLDK
jgi:hypothetical protein